MIDQIDLSIIHLSIYLLRYLLYENGHIDTYFLERDDPPKHFFVATIINSPQCQEFMVSRISSVVTIFLSPLMDEFTLMEVF